MSTTTSGSGPLAAAVADSRMDQVDALLKSGVSPNDRDERGQEAILIATSTDQFLIANTLVDHGADIWVADRLGFTPALFAYTSHVVSDSEEGKARDMLVNRMKAAGYPWPPPWQDEVVVMRQSGNWPPAASKRPLNR